MGYSKDSERQRRYTGALTCQDWPGTSYTGPVRDFFFAGEDLASDARIAGMIAMFFACYGAGSPQFDEFYQKKGMNSERRQIAPEPFLAELPKRMLAHPKGGALAVIGHVDRAWDYSFRAGKTIVQLGTFESVIKEILEGFPVGAALERFSRRYSELASDTTTELNEVNDGKRPDEKLLSSLWCASNDARNYVVVGDPAVRLA